jgi:BTB/POZ domain
VYIGQLQVVLAAASPYFKAMFAGAGQCMLESSCLAGLQNQSKDTDQPCIRLKGMRSEVVRHLLGCTYAGWMPQVRILRVMIAAPWCTVACVTRADSAVVQLDDNRAEEMLAASNFLQMTAIQDACCQVVRLLH